MKVECKTTYLEHNGVSMQVSELKKLVFADIDAPNADAIKNAVRTGKNSYEKWIRIKFADSEEEEIINLD